MATQDYTLQAVKGVKDVFKSGSEASILQYMNSGALSVYATAEDFEIYNGLESGTSVEELGEYDTPPVFTLEEGYQVTIRAKRFGAGILIPQKTYVVDGKDSTMVVDTYIAEQSSQAMLDVHNLLITEAHLMYNGAFESDAKYLAPDGLSVANASHLWSSGGSFSNTTTAALSLDAVDGAVEWGGDAEDSAGHKRPINLDTIVVKKGSPNSRLARKMFAESVSPVAIGDINLYEGEFRIIETPFITYANRAYWFMMDSSRRNPFAVGFTESPTMNNPQVESNESIRSNITTFVKFGVIDMPWMVYCSDGTV